MSTVAKLSRCRHPWSHGPRRSTGDLSGCVTTHSFPNVECCRELAALRAQTVRAIRRWVKHDDLFSTSAATGTTDRRWIIGAIPSNAHVWRDRSGLTRETCIWRDDGFDAAHHLDR